jgi:deoxyribose-phosphate aldolase
MLSADQLTPQTIARVVDISAVQALHGEKEIRELVSYARQYRFIAVHVLPA